MNEKNIREQTANSSTASPKEKERGKQSRLSVVSLIFFVVSFLGWCLETVYCSSGFTAFCDRGFLTLPFCVIYGTPLCLVFFALGTPREGRLATAVDRLPVCKPVRTLLRYALYFLLSGALATLFELVFGAAFDLFGVQLWSYERYPMNFRGYICLPFFFVWGALITAFMSLFWQPLYRLLEKIPAKAARIVNAVLWLAIVADFSLNFGYLLLRGARFEFSFFSFLRR